MGVIERQAASGNDAMDMRVNIELLTPGVQHTEETNFRAEVSRIASDFEKCFRAGAKQEIVEPFSKGAQAIPVESGSFDKLFAPSRLSSFDSICV
jgi:hypothetical protein